MMNLLLHGIEGGVELADTLSPDGERLPKADLVLTNPPFGTKKGGGRPTRSDFSVTADTSNKQLAFVEHIVRALKPGGRAAMVVPDNVLFEDNTGRRLRTWLMDLCSLHTILRLPTGIFYAQGVKTNVLFFQRGKTDKANTKAVWVYDMRANMPAFGKTRPLTVEDFAEFEKAYGNDPNGGAKRKDQGEEGRWRCFTREADHGPQRQSRHRMAARHGGRGRGAADRAGGHRRRHHRAPQGGAGGDRDAVGGAGAERCGPGSADCGGGGVTIETTFQHGWPEVPLGQFLSAIEAGKNLRCEERPPEPHEKGVVKVSSVTWGIFDKTQSKTLPSGYEPNSRSLIRNGDFLISRANTLELVGACVVVEDAPGNLYLSDKVLRLVLPDDIKPWLLNFLRSPIGRARIEAASTGNQLSMRNISQETIRSLMVPLPDRRDRRRIMAKIEACPPSPDAPAITSTTSPGS